MPRSRGPGEPLGAVFVCLGRNLPSEHPLHGGRAAQQEHLIGCGQLEARPPWHSGASQASQQRSYFAGQGRHRIRDAESSSGCHHSSLGPASSSPVHCSHGKRLGMILHWKQQQQQQSPFRCADDANEAACCPEKRGLSWTPEVSFHFWNWFWPFHLSPFSPICRHLRICTFQQKEFLLSVLDKRSAKTNHQCLMTEP